MKRACGVSEAVNVLAGEAALLVLEAGGGTGAATAAPAAAAAAGAGAVAVPVAVAGVTVAGIDQS
jgi:hypothetical protein